MDHQEFIAELLSRFPQLLEAVVEEDGLLHLEMACFARHTQAAIRACQREDVKRCFEFADHIFRQADPELKNAVYVSYLENLSLDDSENEQLWAIKLMSPSLHAGWAAINKYLDDLFSGKTPTPPR